MPWWRKNFRIEPVAEQHASVTLSRTFDIIPFDPAKLKTTIESLSREIVVKIFNQKIYISSIRPSGTKEATNVVPIDALWSVVEFSEQFVTVEWLSEDTFTIDASFMWLKFFSCDFHGTHEPTLERAMNVVIRDLGLTPAYLGMDGPSRHVGDSLSEALRSLDEVLWSRWVQSGRDIADHGRLAYHGPIHDMRDVLAAVLRLLAPDDLVEKQTGFKLESGTNRPTQAQRTRYIITVVRKRGENAVKTAEGALVLAGLSRDTYSRGSEAHVKASREEASQVRRYISALLGDLIGVVGH